MPSPPARGVDHVGITVPDIEAATRFLERAFGAEVVYESLRREESPQRGEEIESTLGLPEGTRVRAVRMVVRGHGPGVELFEMSGARQPDPARPSDHGLQHLAVYVDDIDAASERFEAAGGALFTAPRPLSFAAERGEGNCFCYGRTPWGTVVEMRIRRRRPTRPRHRDAGGGRERSRSFTVTSSSSGHVGRARRSAPVVIAAVGGAKRPVVCRRDRGSPGRR